MANDFDKLKEDFNKMSPAEAEAALERLERLENSLKQRVNLEPPEPEKEPEKEEKPFTIKDFRRMPKSLQERIVKKIKGWNKLPESSTSPKKNLPLGRRSGK